MTHKERFYKKLEELKGLKGWYISENMGKHKAFLKNLKYEDRTEDTYKALCDTLDSARENISKDILNSKDV